jgi:prolipoprotein diacylglyceryltransferase
MLASIPNPSFNGIHVGPVDVRIYGLTYVLGLIAAVVITTHRWEREGGSRELVQGVALWAFRLGSPAAGSTSWPRAGTSPHAIAAERHDVGGCRR